MLTATERVVANAPIEAGTILEQADSALRNGRYNQAIALADSVVTNSRILPARLRGIDILTKAYSELGLINSVDETFQRGLRLMLDSELSADTAALRKNRVFRNLSFNYAQFLLNSGRYDDCLLTAEGIEFPEGSDEALRLEGVKAAAWMRKGELAKALEIYDYALSGETLTDEDIASATLNTMRHNRGYLKLVSGDYSGAESDLTTAIAGMEGKWKEIARANLALALSGLGEHSEALRTVEDALRNLKSLVGESDKDYIIALRKKGEILIEAGQSREATGVFKEFFHLEKERLADMLPDMSPNLRLSYWTMEKPLLSKCFLVGQEDPQFLMDVALMRRETSLLGTGYNPGTADRLNFNTDDLKKRLKSGEAAVAFVAYPDLQQHTVYAAIITDHKGDTGFIPLFGEDFIYADYDYGDSLYDLLLSEDPMDKNKLYSDKELGEKIWEPILSVLPSDVRTIHFAPEGVFHLWGVENMPFEGKDDYRLIRHFSLADINVSSSAGKRDGAILMAGGLDYDDVETEPRTNRATETITNHEAYDELKRNLNIRGKIFSYLPGTAREVNSLADHVPEAVVTSFLTEEDFKNNAPAYRLIHLATHGYTLDCGVSGISLPTDSLGYDLSLLRSGVALTGANTLGGEGTRRDDGILSAREICDLNLRNTDMVVLSACQTAKGMITDESASGLIRALKMAGAGTIVATLWEVDDRSTATFMAYFYEALESGMDKQDAFDKARRLTATLASEVQKRRYSAGALASRKTEETVNYSPFANPWYWAPFILIDP